MTLRKRLGTHVAQYFTGHPAAAQAYAWSSPMEGSKYWWFFAVFASATNYVGRSRKGAHGTSAFRYLPELSGHQVSENACGRDLFE
jgi:hypothetical protein